MKRFTPVLLMVLSLIGLWASAYLTQRHYEILGGRAEKASFCSINKSFDCDAVATSRYADWFGVPVSSFGFGYSLIIFLSSFFVLVLPGKMARTAVSWIAVLSGLALLGDVYLGGILLFRIRIVCLLCLLTYVINVAQFGLCFWGTTEDLNPGTVRRAIKIALDSVLNPFRHTQEVPGGAQMLMLTGMNIFLALVLTGFGNELLRYKYIGDGRVDAEEVRTWFQSLPQVIENLELDRSPSRGNPSARVTIVEFSDFQCPHCRMAARTFEPLLAAFDGDVRMVFKHYPLDQACNPNLEHSVHDKACLFAQAANCARKQPGRDLFWEMHDLIFEEEETLNLTNLGDKAREMGLDREDFLSCLSSPEVKDEVRRDVALGQRVGVRGTPTVIINGKKLPGMVQPVYLRVMIQNLLSK